MSTGCLPLLQWRVQPPILSLAAITFAFLNRSVSMQEKPLSNVGTEVRQESNKLHN